MSAAAHHVVVGHYDNVTVAAKALETLTMVEHMVNETTMWLNMVKLEPCLERLTMFNHV